MDSVAVTVPLRPPTKKMKKRKELDALAAPHAVTRRNSGKRSSQELLTDSSDDRSEYWSVSTRGGRKCRGSRRNRSCPGFLRACSAFLACASVLATATLIWLFIDVREQLTALRTELDQVIAGNEDVPDTLQKYHSLSRDLQNNQTIIFANITDIKLQLVNFTTQLSSIQRGLQDVQETIRTAPELFNVPNQLKELSTEISRWGSRITDLISTANKSKEDYDRIANVQNNIVKNITTIEKTLSETADITHNVSTKVISLDNECARIGVQETLKFAVGNLTADFVSLKSDNAVVQNEIKILNESVNSLENLHKVTLTPTTEVPIQKLNNIIESIATTQSTSSAPENAKIVAEEPTQKVLANEAATEGPNLLKTIPSTETPNKLEDSSAT